MGNGRWARPIAEFGEKFCIQSGVAGGYTANESKRFVRGVGGTSKGAVRRERHRRRRNGGRFVEGLSVFHARSSPSLTNRAMRNSIYTLLANLARRRHANGLLAVGSLALVLLSPRSADTAEIQVLRGLVPAAARSAPVERLSPSKRLHLAIALPLRHREALTNLLQQM